MRISIATLLAVGALLGPLTGCLRYGPDTVERVVAGERRRGPWIPPSGYEHFVRAEMAAGRGAHREAIAEYELARSGVIDGFLLSREAEAAARVPDPALAERLLDEGLESDPHSEPLLVLRGRLALERGDLETAERSLRAAHESAPESAAPVLALSEVLVRTDREDDALALLDAFVVGRPLDVPALRALLAAALVAHDARRASLAALRLVRASPVHRAEVRAAIERALAEGQGPLAHAIFRALPLADDELELRFAAARSMHDDAECARLALRMEDGTVMGRLRAAEHWIVLGDGARAEELAREVLLESSLQSGEQHAPDPRAERIVAEGLLLEHRFADAAELLSRMPTGTTEDEARRTLLARAIAGAGLPALAAETTARTVHAME